MKKEIPVVFAVNNDYTYFGYIAIYSLIKNANTKYFYRIFVFVTDVDDKNRKLLESLSNDNVAVKCIDISSYTKNVVLKSSIHLSIETYYRFFIPIVLSQYKKVLYLDSDICVLGDVSELYELDLAGFPIGAVRDVWCSHIEKHSLEIGNLDYRKTFNAGILVMDTEKFEEENIREKCLEILQEDYKRKVRKFIFADQDALNVVLYENVKMLPDDWNVQSQFAWRPEVLFDDYKDSYFRMLESAKIMHFAGDRKPWMYPYLPKADIFWNIAKETPVFRDVLDTVIGGVRKNANKLNCFDGFRFPYELVPCGSKIAIYGAGAVGRCFVMQNKLTKYAEISSWFDRDALNISDVDVSEVSEICADAFDYIIIAIDDEGIASSIKENLIGMGVPESKIVWDEYHKKNNVLSE